MYGGCIGELVYGGGVLVELLVYGRGLSVSHTWGCIGELLVYRGCTGELVYWGVAGVWGGVSGCCCPPGPRP